MSQSILIKPVGFLQSRCLEDSAQHHKAKHFSQGICCQSHIIFSAAAAAAPCNLNCLLIYQRLSSVSCKTDSFVAHALLFCLKHLCATFCQFALKATSKGYKNTTLANPLTRMRQEAAKLIRRVVIKISNSSRSLQIAFNSSNT